MSILSTIMWVLGAAAFLTIGVIVFRLGWRSRSNWLLRCPETGSIALVKIEPVAECSANSPSSEVRRCGLWPARRNCAQGCLARLAETSPGYHPNPSALRPFESNQQPRQS